MVVEDKKLLKEFREKTICGWCGRPTPGCEPHHVLCRGMAGGGRMDLRENIIPADWLCHKFLQRPEKIPLKAQLEVIAAREGTTAAALEEFLWAVRRLDKSATEADVQKLRETIFGKAA